MIKLYLSNYLYIFMKKFIVKKYIALFLFISLAANAQNNENKWVVGVSGS